MLTLLKSAGPSNEEIRWLVVADGYRITSLAVARDDVRRLEFHLEWYSRKQQDHIPPIVEALSARQDISCIEWTPINAGHLFE